MKYSSLSIFFIFLSINLFCQENVIDENIQPILIINKIIISGNKVTKNHIIIRELEFKAKDTISARNLNVLIKNSKQNLLNISLFNFVTIDTSFAGFQKINININVVERWYTWPVPVFEIEERNFNTWWETKNLERASYGFYLLRNNFRGRKETLKFLLCLGYNQSYGLDYEIPYLNKKQTIGLKFSAVYTQNHEVAYNTLNDTLAYYKTENNYLKKEFLSSIELIIRKKIHNTHNIKLSYNSYNFDDTLVFLNKDYSYFGRENLSYFSFYYKFKNDYRNYSSYPLTGHYFDIEINKNGFGILKDECLDIFFIKSVFRKYWKLYNKFYFASGVSGKLSSKSFQPYFMQEGLGYGRNFVRGYEYYVVDGQNYAMLKTNFKYELLPTKIHTFKFLKSEKFNKIHYAFYLNIFADVGYVEDVQFYKNNTLSNETLFGSGIGLDFVTYYDKVLRIEYSINKMKETGVFLHFIAPI